MTPDELRARVDAILPSVRADLEDLVRIPSVSADPARADEVRRSAAATAALFAAEGFEVQELTAPGGLPSVIARKPAPDGAPTVLLYAHHDVQPTGDRASWDSEPFEPTERDGRLFARGAADDKAGIAAHLAAVRALGDDLAVGVTVFVEGEEEVGSPTLAQLLAEHQELLRSDVIVIADSTNWDTRSHHVAAGPRRLRRRAAHSRPCSALRHVGRCRSRRADHDVPAARHLA